MMQNTLPLNTTSTCVICSPPGHHHHHPCSPGKACQGRVAWTSRDNVVKGSWILLELGRSPGGGVGMRLQLIPPGRGFNHFQHGMWSTFATNSFALNFFSLSPNNPLQSNHGLPNGEFLWVLPSFIPPGSYS